MSIRVQIPGPLRSLTGGAAEVQAEAGDLAGLIEALAGLHPGLRERLLDDTGKLRSYVRLFVDDEDVRVLQGLATPLRDGCVVAIVPAIAGGCRPASSSFPAASPK
jgi:molybdopterin synthase sulfur carrier subunit